MLLSDPPSQENHSGYQQQTQRGRLGCGHPAAITVRRSDSLNVRRSLVLALASVGLADEIEERSRQTSRNTGDAIDNTIANAEPIGGTIFVGKLDQDIEVPVPVSLPEIRASGDGGGSKAAGLDWCRECQARWIQKRVQIERPLLNALGIGQVCGSERQGNFVGT